MAELVVKDFNLKHTLECGQFFRFYYKDGWYYVNSRDKFFRVRQKGDINGKLVFEGVSAAFLKRFFSLDVDYSIILKDLLCDKHLKMAISKYRGLRLIRQDPWECTISYICSAAANIPKIKMNVRLLSEKYGYLVRQKDEESYTFPEPGLIKHLCDVQEAKTGFRAKYICAINTLVDDNYFSSLKRLDYKSAKQELIKLPGVGGKVADCVLLFSLDKGGAFPVDVWIRRLMQELYFNGENVGDVEILEFAQNKWGKYAGIAQQYLYHWWRNKH